MAIVPESPPLVPSADLEPLVKTGKPASHVRSVLAFIAQRLLASPVTLTLIATCVVLDLIIRLWGPGPWRSLTLWHMGERQWSAILDGEVHRLFAAEFLHRDGRHLVSNMSTLLMSGLLLEPVLGGRRFMLLYTACYLAGALAYLLDPAHFAVIGASGAIVGMTCALVGYRLRLSIPFPLPLSNPAYVVVQLCALVADGPLLFGALARSRVVLGIAVALGVGVEALLVQNLGHLGGGLAGMLLSYTLLVRPRQLQKAAPPGLSFLSLMAGMAWAAALGSIGVAIAVGQPWRVKDEPPFATVPLKYTRFSVGLPRFSGGYPMLKDGTSMLFFHATPHAAPVTLFFSVSTNRDLMSAEEYLDVALAVEARYEKDEPFRPRTVKRIRVGKHPALRVDTEQDGGTLTHVKLHIDGYSIWVSGRREAWAAEANPPIWDGIEERVAASFRLVDE